MRSTDGAGVKRRTILSAAAAGLLAPAACGSGSDQDAVRLLTPVFEGKDGRRALEELLDEFGESHSGASVEVDYTSYDKLNEKITTSMSSGRPYDVMMMGVGWIQPFASKKLLAELSDDADELAETYFDRAIDPCVYRGKAYALPVMLDTRFGIYRKDMFDEAGIERPPEDFSQLREYARKLTVRDGGAVERAGLDFMSNDPRQTFETLLWAAGGELFDQDGDPAFNSSHGVAALELMVDSIHDDKTIEIGFAKPGETSIPLLDDRAAMVIGHNNLWLELRRQQPDLLEDDKIGTFVIADERPAMFQGGTLVTMSSHSARPDVAKSLVRFLAGSKASLAASRQRGNVPAVKSLVDSKYVKENEFVRFAMDNMESAYSEGGVAAWLKIREEFKAAIESAWLKEKSPKRALDDLADKATAAIAD